MYVTPPAARGFDVHFDYEGAIVSRMLLDFDTKNDRFCAKNHRICAKNEFFPSSSDVIILQVHGSKRWRVWYVFI